MSVLVDYRCDRCLGDTEAWVPSPVPTTRPCPACGGTAKRVWSPVGLVRGGSTRAEQPRASKPAQPAQPLCVHNPDVPGLCHMSPAAGRTWLARARKDNRSLDRELERQERAAAIRPPTLADMVSHDHGHDHGHGQPCPRPLGRPYEAP